MKLNCKKVITNLKGKPFQEEGKNLTLGDVCCNALLFSYPEEKNVSGKVKYERWKLAAKLVDGGTVDVTLEDMTLIKDLVGKFYGPLLVGPIYNILEGIEETKEATNGQEQTKTKAKKAKGILSHGLRN